MQEIIYPRSLQKGDQVCLIDPANAYTEAGVDAAVSFLEGKGLQVRVADDMAFRHGTPIERAGKLNRIFQDENCRGIFCIWGGYGTMSLLDYLDYDAIKKNRQIFAGFSDITAMHLAIGQKSGLVTYHSPALYSEKRPTTTEALEQFWDKIENVERERELKNLNGEDFQVLREGDFEGIVTGGNMTLVSRLMGTEYEIDTKGKVLFLEEVGEMPYRLHGMLSQLRMAGKLQDVKGILIGALTDCDTKGRPGSAMALVQDALEGIDIQIIANVRAGHIKDPITIPLHGKLKVSGGRIWQCAAE